MTPAQVTLDSTFSPRDSFVTITVENIGENGVKIPTSNFIVYEDDTNPRSTLYFESFYFDKYGLAAFNHYSTAIDYVDDNVDYRYLKVNEKLEFRANPFNYCGEVEGKNEYLIDCCYRIRTKCGDLVFKSNKIQIFIGKK
jgi:hypothetical protein